MKNTPEQLSLIAVPPPIAAAPSPLVSAPSLTVVRSTTTLDATAADPVTATAAPELWAALQFDAGDATLTLQEREQRCAQWLARARSLTPRICVEPPDALLLEVGGSCRLFGGLAGLLQQLRLLFPRPMLLAVAPTPLAALLLARAGQARCLTHPARLASRLAPLPIHLLRWPERERLRLQSMGVSRLGELLRLPREGLARRLGPERLAELDRLTGSAADPRPSVPLTERFAEKIDPGFETRSLDALLAALAAPLSRLEEFLRTRQRGVLALRLTLRHRKAAPTVAILRLAATEYRAHRFAALLAARLESLTLPEPVRRIDLQAGHLRRLPGDSALLWSPGEQGGGGHQAVPEFLQTLLARLGERAVHGLALVPEHRPERQSAHPHTTARSRSTVVVLGAVGATDVPSYQHRPLALLPQPQPLLIERDAGGRISGLRHHGIRLQLVTGPERIESGWWDGVDIARDYYVARAGNGSLWWVFRECGVARRWCMHGCFA